mgnify:FL=1
MVTLTINGISVTVPKGTTILTAAESIGIDIPTLCYDKDLSIVGASRMCVVEVEGARNLVAACSTPVAEGMKVETESERVVKARKTIHFVMQKFMRAVIGTNSVDHCART